MKVPNTKYVAVGGADVAYQVIGEGPVDVLHFYGLGNHIDLAWDLPSETRLISGLVQFSRVITFDRRGTGASGGSRDDPPTWEEWTEDVDAVLDIAGAESIAIIAELDAGPIAVLYAAMHPARVRALVLANTTARYLVDHDYPIGVSPDAFDGIVEMIGAQWGTTDFVRSTRPSVAHDPHYLEAVARRQRAAASPRTAAAQYRYLLEDVDVRGVLPLVQAPTLVLHSQQQFVSLAHGRYLADQINGARLVELPLQGVTLDDQMPGVSAEIAQFLTGERPVVEIDRILTTVLFTDIVGSTEHAASLGDRRWRQMLDAHDRTVREELGRFRGRELNTTGDGFFVSFDGPARAIRCAKELTGAIAGLGIAIRAGIHVGECEVRGDDLAGLAVHIAARVGALASANEVLVSSTVKDLVVGSGIDFADRGEHELRGVPGPWRLFSAEG